MFLTWNVTDEEKKNIAKRSKTYQFENRESPQGTFFSGNVVDREGEMLTKVKP